MSGLFKAGQLVRIVDFEEGPVYLWNEPGNLNANARSTGMIRAKDVALVIALNRADGSNIYVVGPSGGGWTFGALLRMA